jgi:hypothetical protein
VGRNTCHAAGRSTCAHPACKGCRSCIHSTRYFRRPFQLSYGSTAIRERKKGLAQRRKECYCRSRKASRRPQTGLIWFLSTPVSHTPTCRSLIRLKPVVVDAVTRAPLMPPWPLPTLMASSPPTWGSNRRSLPSRYVVTRSWPVGLNARLCMVSA